MRRKTAFFTTLLLIIIVSLSFSAELKKVKFNEAKNVAKVWINRQISSLEKIGIEGVRWDIVSFEEIKEKGITIGYNFNLYPSGHVFVSAYKFLPPIKIYSYSSPIENSNLLPLIKKIYYGMIKKAKKFSDEKLKKIAYENREIWKNYLITTNSDTKLMSKKITIVIKGPVVKTRWDQNNPYNKYSPVIKGKKSYAGCVATSFSQIMKYWNYPPKGQGAHSYVTDTHHVSVSTSFDHPYYWDNMPNSISTASPSSQIDAVARLIFDVGVAVDMDFTPDGSGAYPSIMVKRMPMYFKYSTNIKYDEYYNYKDLHKWFEVIKKEIDASIPRPVNLSIYSNDVGHSVVVDGYKIDGSEEYFHINMGWSGYYDGYYRPNNIREFNKIEWEHAIINIYPSELPNAPKPPTGISAKRTTKSFLLYNLYYDIITWKASPTGDANLNEYRVYEKTFEGDEVNEKMIAVVKVNKPKYLIIPKGVVSTKVAYTVTAVGKNGVESIKPDYIIVQ